MEAPRGECPGGRSGQGVDGTGDSVDMLRPDGHAASLVGRRDRPPLGARLARNRARSGQHVLRVPQAGARRRGGRLGRAARDRGFRIVHGLEQLQRAGGRRRAQLGVPTVPNALKPLPFGFLRALRLAGHAAPRNRGHRRSGVHRRARREAAGLQTVLTEPLVPHDFPLTRVLRFLERLVYKRTPPAPGLPIFRGED